MRKQTEHEGGKERDETRGPGEGVDKPYNGFFSEPQRDGRLGLSTRATSRQVCRINASKFETESDERWVRVYLLVFLHKSELSCCLTFMKCIYTGTRSALKCQGEIVLLAPRFQEEKNPGEMASWVPRRPKRVYKQLVAPSAAVNALGLTRKPCSSWHQLPGPGLFWATPAACSCFRVRVVFAEAKGRNQIFPLKGRNLAAAPSIRVLGLRRSADRRLALFAFRSW